MHRKIKISDALFILLAIGLMVISLALVSCGDESNKLKIRGVGGIGERSFSCMLGQ